MTIWEALEELRKLDLSISEQENLLLNLKTDRRALVKTIGDDVIARVQNDGMPTLPDHSNAVHLLVDTPKGMVLHEVAWDEEGDRPHIITTTRPVMFHNLPCPDLRPTNS